MDFRTLTAGCRFAKKPGAAGANVVSSSAPLAGGDVGALDFFGSGAPAEAAKPDASCSADAADAKSAARRKRKSHDLGADTGDAAEATTAEPSTLSAQEVSEANALRRTLRIHAYGTDLEPPVQGIADLETRYPIKPFLSRNVQSAGYHELTRVQMQATPTTAACCTYVSLPSARLVLISCPRHCSWNSPTG